MLKAGDKVDIVGGIYKRYGKGTYVCAYGKKMCTVQVHGDKERNVRLTSIRKVEEPTTSESSQRQQVVLSINEYNELQQEIAFLTKALQALELKVKGFGR
jgi:hypothetical protein